MRKNYLICLFFAGLMSQVSFAQPVGLGVGSVSLDCSGGQTITIPVTMANGTNITACQFTLQWDPTVLQFIAGSGQLQGAFTTPSIMPNFGESQVAAGRLTYGWIDSPGVTTGPNATTMFTVQFNVLSLAATSINIIGSPTPIKVGQGGPPVVNQMFTLSSGSVTTGDVEPPILVCPAEQTVPSDIPLIINDLTPIAYDDCGLNSLEYLLSGATNAMGFGDASGQETFQLGTTTIQYTAIDDAGNSETCISYIHVNPDTLTVIAQSRTGDCDEPLYIDILVENFDAVSTLGFTLNWDKTVLKFDSVNLLENNFIGVKATDFGYFQVANGKLTFAWYDAANHTAPDGTRLFRIHFKTIGGSGAASPIAFSSNPTPQLAGSGVPTPTQIPAIWENGTATIIDMIAPTIVCPGNEAVNNVAIFPLAISGLAPTVGDNCAVDYVTYSLANATTGSGTMPADGTLSFNEGTTTVTQTVFDVAGNFTQCTFTVTLTGTAKPKFILPGISAECGPGQIEIDLTVTDFKNVADLDLFVGFLNNVLSIDAVGGFNPAMGPSSNWFTTTVGNTIQIGYVNTPNNVGVTLPDGSVLLKIYAKPIGAAGTMTLLTFTQPPTANSPFGPYLTQSQDGFVSIVDTKGPVISGCPFDFQVTVDATCKAIANWATATATDACDGANITLTSDIKLGDTLALGSHKVTYTATDDSNNKTTCAFTINVFDGVFPTIKCPANDTLAFDAGQCTVTLSNLPQPISFSDNCTANPTLIPPQIQLPQTLAAGQVLNIEYVVVDDAGNASFCNFMLSAPALTPPSTTICPTTQNVSCDALGTFNVPVPVFVQGCGPALTYSVSPVDTTNFAIGTTQVVFTAANSVGNATCTFNVIVKDTKKPEITGCPADVTLQTSAGCMVTMPNYQVQVMDNCDNTVDVSYTPTPGSQLPVGVHNVIVVATDDSGNFATCDFTIVVQAAQTAVLLNCPPDSVYLEKCTVQATWTDPQAAGFCGTVSLIESNPANFVMLFAGLPDTISYTATDMAGNTATCSFILSATESTPPTLDCPPSITVDVAGNIISDLGNYILDADTVAGCNAVQLFFGIPTANDDCIGVNLQQNTGPASGSSFPLGTNSIYWRAMDASGNTATCSIEITVIELDTPTIIGSPDPACLGDVINLTTNINAPSTIYSWTGLNGFTSMGATAVIFGLTSATAGPYLVNTSVNGCPAPQSLPFTAVLSTKPVLSDDAYSVEITAALDSFNILSNDLLTAGDNFTVTLQSPPSSGTLDNHGNGIFSYTAPATAVGGVNFGYIVCSETCPGLCDTALVYIDVKESTNCSKIPKVITPNGDGFNDYFYIFCIDTGLFPNNSLIVFNQWGDKVYEAAPYINSQQDGWYGTLDGEAGKDLPDGTYYYIFKPSQSEPAIKGVLTIFR